MQRREGGSGVSIRVMAWVWEHSNSVGADRLVLLAIADSANDAGRDAYPSMMTIARKAKMDKRTAQRSVRALVALGELSVKENAGPRGTNRYRIIMPKGRQDATPRGETPPVMDHPGDTPPVASDPQGGGISSPKGRQDATRTILNPPLTRPTGESSTGDRHETLRAVPDTEPTCSAHPLGDGGTNCGGCRRVRLWRDKNEASARDAAQRLRDNCPDCHGTNWLEGEFGKPAAKCDHRRAAS
jgi:hypothetical protein